MPSYDPLLVRGGEEIAAAGTILRRAGEDLLDADVPGRRLADDIDWQCDAARAFHHEWESTLRFFADVGEGARLAADAASHDLTQRMLWHEGLYG